MSILEEKLIIKNPINKVIEYEEIEENFLKEIEENLNIIDLNKTLNEEKIIENLENLFEDMKIDDSFYQKVENIEIKEEEKESFIKYENYSLLEEYKGNDEIEEIEEMEEIEEIILDEEIVDLEEKEFISSLLN
jgi:hypothetical protein